MECEELPEAKLAAFIAQQLPDATRRGVVEHIANCNECYDRWDALRGTTTRSGAVRRRSILLIAAIVAAAILTALSWTRFRGSDSTNARASNLDMLAARAAELRFRPLVPRLSAAFAFRPLKSPTRGGALDTVEELRLAGVAGDLKLLAHRAPTQQNLHALGLSYLLLGYVEQGVQTLEEAHGRTAHATADPAVLSDLAAAYYARGIKQRAIRDIAQSLEFSDTALEASERNVAAQYNRALALEALENLPAARAAWQQYLRLDPSSPWAAEAREHLSRLSVPPQSSAWPSLEKFLRLAPADLNELGAIAVRFPLRTRRTVENELLPRWAAARSRHDEKDAALVLSALDRIGAVLQSRFNDPTVADTAHVISVADEGRLELLAQGYGDYAKARAAVDASEARASFHSAWLKFSQAHSPSAYAAGMLAIVQEYDRRNYDEALALLDAMKAEPALKRYAPLQGQLDWVHGMVLLASGRPQESLERYRSAIRAFERSGEIECVAAVDGLIAENLQALGDEDEAWKHRLHALPITLDYADTRRQQVAFNEAAEAAMQQNQLSAALDYQTSSVELCEGSDDHHMVAYAYLGRAVILGRKGRVAAAKLDIGRAREAALRVADATLRRSTTSDVDMGEALLLQTKSPAEAIPLLTRVLDYQQSGRYEFRTAQLLLARGRSYVRVGDDDSARADFSNAIKAVESQRSQVVDLRLRSAFFGRAEEAYSELTALLVRSGEFDEARRVFDRSCERTLTEVVQKSIGPHSDPAFTEAHAVPSGTALVHVAVLAGEVVGWTMRSSGTSISRQPVSSSELNALIASYEAAIGANSDAVQTIGSRLYDLLVRPLGLDAAADETVIFVTDRTLRAVPMASLYDRSHNRYLIEDFAIATAPSAAVYWHCSARLARDRVRANVVAIGNAKAGALSLGLADLPEAERELREVASQSGGELLLNESATPGRLLAAAAEPSIIHFAGHAVVNEQDAGRSALVLAPEGKGAPSALLNADRIARASLRARLIVLSACATNATSPRLAKGAVDVSRAFLAAGVPTVVTSRWEVADGSARDLLKRFAREVASGVVTPAEALRRSQLQMLHGGNSSQRAVRAWCAFEVVGAV